MSKLVPTVITDVNGRITTVHRKQAEAGKTTTVPSPAVKGINPSSQRDPAVVEELVNALGLRMQFANPNIKENIASLTDGEVELLRESLSSVPPRVLKQEEFQSAMVYPLNANDGQAGRHMTNTLALLESELPVFQHQPFLATIRKHTSFKEAGHDLYAADDETKKLVCGIANAVHMLRKQETFVQDKFGSETRVPMVSTKGKYLTLLDPALMPAMLDHPEHAETIASLYLKRGNINALDEVINTSTAIRDGAL